MPRFVGYYCMRRYQSPNLHSGETTNSGDITVTEQPIADFQFVPYENHRSSLQHRHAQGAPRALTPSTHGHLLRLWHRRLPTQNFHCSFPQPACPTGPQLLPTTDTGVGDSRLKKHINAVHLLTCTTTCLRGTCHISIRGCRKPATPKPQSGPSPQYLRYLSSHATT